MFGQDYLYPLETGESHIHDEGEALHIALDSVALAAHTRRTSLEQTMATHFDRLGTSWRSEYFNSVVESRNWSDAITWLADAGEKLLSSTDTELQQQLARSKGIAVSLGVEVYHGRWHNTGESRIDRSARKLLLDNDPNFTVHVRERKNAEVAYQLGPVLNEGEIKFSWLERNRAVGDVELPNGRTLHIAKRAISLVCSDELPEKAKKKHKTYLEMWINKKENEFPEAKQRAERAIGTVFENAKRKRSHTLGVLPESASYILRLPYRNSAE